MPQIVVTVIVLAVAQTAKSHPDTAFITGITVAVIGLLGTILAALINRGRRESSRDHGFVRTALEANSIMLRAMHTDVTQIRTDVTMLRTDLTSTTDRVSALEEQEHTDA